MLPNILLVSFGKSTAIYASLMHSYEQRLTRMTTFKHTRAQLKEKEEDLARRASSKTILTKQKGKLLVFDERGKAFTSQKYADILSKAGPEVTLAVGSSYGVSADLLKQADYVISLSSMTLPHEIARLLVLEQTYRAGTILANHPYHH